MATNSAINSTNPIGVPSGGTGDMTLTQYGILYGNGTGAVGVTAAGSANQLLTSNGASAPTYQAAPTNLGNLVRIQSQAASTSANISFTTGIGATYSTYLFVLTNVVPATNTDLLRMQISTDGGSTYVSTGYTAGLNSNPYNSITLTNTNSTTLFPLSAALSNTANTGFNGSIYAYNVTNGGNVYISGIGSFNGSTAGAGACALIGGSVTTANANAFQFTMSSGNISTGTFTLYGVLEA